VVSVVLVLVKAVPVEADGALAREWGPCGARWGGWFRTRSGGSAPRGMR